MEKKENNQIQLVNSYETYGLDKKSEAHDTIPKWMEETITNRKVAVDTDKFKNIWP